jgi:hypothetical protein
VLKLVLSVLCFSYDAWIVYSFFSLCLAWVGGPGDVVVFLLASNYAYRRGFCEVGAFSGLSSNNKCVCAAVIWRTHMFQGSLHLC